MKLRSVSIDGYGKFAGREIEFAPGLQIIIGPNERGKSTIRSFIGDMLYGQKRSALHRLFDETNELRTPWHNPDCYGGRLVYALSDGQVIEVARNFDRKREQVQVFDHTSGLEITQDFELLRNKEVNFAAKHLGLSKEVFLNSATITHFSLEHLGDNDALKQIREKLMSLADTGEEEHSAETTLALLRERIEAIGQPSARSKPLPSTRAALMLLDQELTAAREREESTAKVADERRALLGETTSLRQERLELEEMLALHQQRACKAQCEEADALSAQVDKLNQRCAKLRALEEFPLKSVPKVQAAQQEVDRLRAQLKRTRAENKTVQDQFNAERQHLNDEQDGGVIDLPEELEGRFTDLNAAVQHTGERLKESVAALAEAERTLAVNQENIEKLPDFSRISSDPVEWITQLASSYDAARRSREEEARTLAEVTADVDERRQNIAKDHALFKEVSDFSEKAREYDLKERVLEQETTRVQTNMGALEEQRDDIRDDLPGMLLLVGLCGLSIAAIVVAYFVTKNYNILILGGVIFLAMLYFLRNYLLTHKRLVEIEATICNNGIPPKPHSEEEDGDAQIAALMAETGCETVRELEATYDAYRAASAALSARIHVLHEQEARAEEAAERVPRLLEHVTEMFREVGVTVETEDDVQRAAGSVIARYQEYREAKKNIAESHSQIDRQNKERVRLEEMLARDREQLVSVEDALRKIMTAAGIAPEPGRSMASALRAYRNATSERREHRARAELLQDRAHTLERQIHEEQLEIEKADQELARLLAHAGVSNIDDFQHQAERAREFREQWNQRVQLQERLDAVLKGEKIEALRAEVAEVVIEGDPPAQSREELTTALDTLNARIEANLEREHALHISITERAAGGRSINEIEESRTVLAKRMTDLEHELEATSYAMAVIDEIARDKHARIAPRLAERASAYLSEITGGAYQEIDLARDLGIRVRIPDTNELHTAPEKSLSKGTVDQIYLALRLALVQCVSDVGEPIPMILDDPFANYDDHRLERTLKLIAEISDENQVLLFTCREDVVRAAETVNAPVIRL